MFGVRVQFVRTGDSPVFTQCGKCHELGHVTAGCTMTRNSSKCYRCGGSHESGAHDEKCKATTHHIGGCVTVLSPVFCANRQGIIVVVKTARNGVLSVLHHWLRPRTLTLTLLRPQRSQQHQRRQYRSPRQRRLRHRHRLMKSRLNASFPGTHQLPPQDQNHLQRPKVHFGRHPDQSETYKATNRCQ
jgi:hypothetical protein